MSVEHPEIEHWREVLPHREDVLVDYVDSFKNHVVLYERRNGLRQIRIISTSAPENVQYVEFPEPAYSVDFESNPQYESDILRFGYSSLITPHSVIDYHMDTGEWELVRQDEIPRGYDITQYVSQRTYAVASDGKPVPISLVHKRNLFLDGNNPTLLYGMGPTDGQLTLDSTPG